MAKYRKGLPTADSAALEAFEEVEESGGSGGAEAEDGLEIVQGLFLLGGKPFSALNRELVPQYFDQPQELFDEFGFRMAEEMDADGRTDPTAERTPPLESSAHRMRWLAMVESAHSHLEESLLTWAMVDVQRLRDTPKFAPMVHAEGIPHSLRPFLWPKLSGAAEKRKKCPYKYARIVRKSKRESAPMVDAQIEKDLLRTLPTHFSFARPHCPGISPLRRILRAMAFMFPELGYCQGMGVVVASLLLICCEENTFWIMCSLIEDILPSSYYAPSLLGVRADERVLRHLIQVHMPELTELLEEQSADTTMVFINWLITLLCSAFPPRILFRIWDHLFCFGPATLFRTILAILKLGESNISAPSSSGSSPNLFGAISRIPADIDRPDPLLEMAQSFEYSVTDHLINELRKKYQRNLMAEIGLIGTAQTAEGTDRNQNLPKQRVTKRNLYRSKSIVRRIFDKKKGAKGRGQGDEEDPRTKNIRQTELVLDLRNAILQICAHFAECTEQEHRGRTVHTQADYSVGFEAEREREQYFRGQKERKGRKRARALIDFEGKEQDELKFSRNDLILITSEKDEHCWVGELDGRRGWFPAKFVQVMDERGKDYCTRGDEAICPRVAELVRGPLAFAFHQILCHGLRPSHPSGLLPESLSSSAASPHPWTFIESICRAIAPSPSWGTRSDRAGRANNTKLSLCSTFCLDQEQRVLGPEQLLHLAVRTIRSSHGAANAPADAKLRSLVAFGLNEQCLHLWFDLFCHCPGQDTLRQQHFRSWSFIRSPASLQISCELKLLAQFAFNLDVDSEIVSAEELARNAAGMGRMNLKGTEEEGEGRGGGGGGGGGSGQGQQMRKGVQDMLIRHHLFSWDL